MQLLNLAVCYSDMYIALTDFFLCARAEDKTIVKRLNLKGVAEKLGVSTATVSNAFNRPDQLSKNLRERILSEAARLGYHGPNLAARSLRRGRSDVIGVMLSDSLTYSFSDPMANQMLQGISEVLMEHHKQLLLFYEGKDNTAQSSAESLPDGFIFYGLSSLKTFERIVALGKPCVTIDFIQDKIPNVGIDDRSAAKKVATHAIAQKEQASVAVLGMKLVVSDRVCRLTQDDLDETSGEISRQRLHGYLDAAIDSAITIPPESMWSIPFNTGKYAEIAAKEAFSSSYRPNVILCMSDVIALAAISAAQSMGLNVPDDVVIVGFDDISEAKHANPSLTTVCQRNAQKGKVAAKMLLENNLTNSILETRLVIRKSSSPTN